jgi:hypothetical protein
VLEAQCILPTCSPERNPTAAIGQDMASAHLPQGISVGTILWIKELADSNDNESHGLPSICFKHPCVVLDLPASMKGFAQIYVVRVSCIPLTSLPVPSQLITREQITSKGGRNINDLPLSAKVRSHHVPIHPTPFNNLLPGVQLHLAGDVVLRKDSYVNTQIVYTLPLSKLDRYKRKRPVTDFRLDATSIRWLGRKASGESVLSAEIKPTITATPTSKLLSSSNTAIPQYASNRPSSQYTHRPLAQYASQLPCSYNTNNNTTIQTLPQYMAVPSARPQIATTTTVGITRFPPRPKFTVLVVAILILLATAVLLVPGITLWALSGFHVLADWLPWQLAHTVSKLGSIFHV